MLNEWQWKEVQESRVDKGCIQDESTRKQNRSAVAQLYCASIIAVAFLIPRLHEGYADHYHVYCTEHHRIEDAGPKQRIIATIDTSRRDAEFKTGAWGIDKRPECTFSNIAVQQADGPTSLHRAPSTRRDEQRARIDIGMGLSTL